MAKNKFKKVNILLFFFLVLEVCLLLVISGLTGAPFIGLANAGVGGNVNVTTYLTIGNVYPEILSININGGSNTMDLTPNASTNLMISIIARDFNGQADIVAVNATFFDMISSSFGAADDNNTHYQNRTCTVDTGYGDIYEVNATCIIPIYYYANNASWNATATVADLAQYPASYSNTITINSLLAVGLPESIDYGTVNATAVSDEKLANVTNFGNVPINISLSGYALIPNDNLSMNCTLGAIKNISIEHEKYNLTASNPGVLNYAQFQINHTNLSSISTVRKFNLPHRQNDNAPYTDDTNATYWRIYVPTGVAGSCKGNIVFGATRADGV